MPPLPSLRRSPVTELRKGSSRRGRSLDSGLLLKAKDDDLFLFNEIQKHEKGNFLLRVPDNFDDSISKVRYISDFKLGIGIPAQGESSGLLNVDGDKNDYDWLLTPPDTPLFPSLDDDEPQPVNTSRGRTRSQPIPISRPFMNEKTQRTSRSSANPHRLSSSPQSSNGILEPAARPCSASRSTIPPVIQQTTPSRVPSSPPTKPSTPTPRSSTPTFQRMSTGAVGQALSSSRRGTSPIKTNRVHSVSPKLRGWQSNLLGFSMNAPSNLQTSLSDRSASRVQGSSPASSNSMDSSSKFGRQSISPSASRSASLSHGHERHQFASCSKASAASSGDHDVDSALSIAVGVSGHSTVRKYGAFVNVRAMTSKKTTSRLPSTSSGPRSYFDSVDHQKYPQNMLRPLLSSVPAATFYVGKTNNVHRTMFFRNLSHTTSGNASSKCGLNFAPNMEDSDHYQSDLAGEWGKIKDAETQEEVPILNKFNEISEDNGHGTRAGKLHSGTKDFDECMSNEVDIQELESSAGNIGDAVSAAPALQCSHIAKFSEINCNGIFTTCSKCGKCILIMAVDGYTDVCQECAATDELLDAREHGVIVDKTLDETGKHSPETPVCKVHLQMRVTEVTEKNSSELMLGQHGKSITGRESSSASSSSVDLGSSRKTDICVLCQLSSRKDKVGNMQRNCNMNAESTDSHSEASVSVIEASTCPSSESEKVVYRIVKSGYDEDIQETLVDTTKHKDTNEDTNLSVAEKTYIEKAFIDQDMSVCTGTSVASDCSYAQLSSPEFCFQLHDTPVADNLNEEHCTLSGKANEVLFQNDRTGISDVEIEVPITTLDSSSIDGNHILNGTGYRDYISDSATHSSSNLILEQQTDHCFQDSQNANADSEMPNYMADLQEGLFLTISDKDILVSASESNCAEHPLCKPNVTVEAPRRSTQTTFALEEAAETILFCSSIVHDLVSKAATIGMRKEMALTEVSCPTFTHLAKSFSNQKYFQDISYKHIQNSRKFRRKRQEIDNKKPPQDLGDNDKNYEFVSSNAEVPQMVDSKKPPKLESKCNCTVM